MVVDKYPWLAARVPPWLPVYALALTLVALQFLVGVVEEAFGSPSHRWDHTGAGADPRGVGADPRVVGVDHTGAGADPRVVGVDHTGVGADPR
eukprot:3788723-Pyramimonas_sp.AAC.1